MEFNPIRLHKEEKIIIGWMQIMDKIVNLCRISNTFKPKIIGNMDMLILRVQIRIHKIIILLGSNNIISILKEDKFINKPIVH